MAALRARVGEIALLYAEPPKEAQIKHETPSRWVDCISVSHNNRQAGVCGVIGAQQQPNHWPGRPKLPTGRQAKLIIAFQRCNGVCPEHRE